MGPDAGKEGGDDWADPAGGAAEEVRCPGRAAGWGWGWGHPLNPPQPAPRRPRAQRTDGGLLAPRQPLGASSTAGTRSPGAIGVAAFNASRWKERSGKELTKQVSMLYDKFGAKTKTLFDARQEEIIAQNAEKMQLRRKAAIRALEGRKGQKLAVSAAAAAAGGSGDLRSPLRRPLRRPLGSPLLRPCD